MGDGGWGVRPAAVGLLIVAGMVVAWLTLPARRVSYTTNTVQVEAIWRELLPGVAVPAGFTGKLGIERQLVVLGGPRGQLIAAMAGPGAELEAQVGPVPEGSERSVLTLKGRAVLLQGRKGDLPPSPIPLPPSR